MTQGSEVRARGSAGYGVERELAAAVLRLRYGEGGCDRGGAHDLAAVGTDRFLGRAEAGDKVAKRCHDSKAPGEMGSVELSTIVHSWLELRGLVWVVWREDGRMEPGTWICGNSGRFAKSQAEFRCDFAVAGQAQRAEVV